MPNSASNDHSNTENTQISSTQNRICDFCSESVALIYCRPDSAKLCLSCDREVHSTNPLFTKHTRFQLCDGCDSSPATIFCCTENSVLCQNCDYEVHNHSKNGSSLNHDRRPLEGFNGCPSVVELSGIIGFEDFDPKSLVLSDENDNKGGFFNGGLFNNENEDDGFSDLFVWDVPTMVNLDDLIVSTDKTHNFHAMVVPPLPKDRNVSCGKHKHEILRQLRELVKVELLITQDVHFPVRHPSMHDNQKGLGVQHRIGAYQHEEEQPTFGGNEMSPFTWCTDTGDAVNDIFHSSTFSASQIEENTFNSDTHSNICSSANPTTSGINSQYPISNDSPGLPQKVPTRELCTAERGSAISRYKEKKRTRRFQKHIRYESRKVQAENRTRIKGRFAKVDNRRTEA